MTKTTHYRSTTISSGGSRWRLSYSTGDQYPTLTEDDVPLTSEHDARKWHVRRNTGLVEYNALWTDGDRWITEGDQSFADLIAAAYGRLGLTENGGTLVVKKAHIKPARFTRVKRPIK
jgi:hypothetical protein